MLDGPEDSSESGVFKVTPLLPSLSAFFCCSSCVMLSTGKDVTIFSVAVGSRARTVMVQSSWFC